MSEVLFYHLETRPLEQVLPLLLEKTLQRGWRAVVQTASRERAHSLSDVLWTWRDEAFIGHGVAGHKGADASARLQPVWLTDSDETPNGATVRFLVDGTARDDLEGFERVIYMFNGHDEEALVKARARWKFHDAQDHAITYWRQDETGKWNKKA